MEGMKRGHRSNASIVRSAIVCVALTIVIDVRVAWRERHAHPHDATQCECMHLAQASTSCNATRPTNAPEAGTIRQRVQPSTRAPEHPSTRALDYGGGLVSACHR